jgi:hypothetical protein
MISTSFHNPASFFQIISGNHGNDEGPDFFNANETVPDWLAHRFQGYGFTSIEVSPRYLNVRHYETNLDASLGRLVDHVRVSKTPEFINKQKIVH